MTAPKPDLLDAIKALAGRVRDVLILRIDEECPHGTEDNGAHPEGTCEVCDYTFFVAAEISDAFESLDKQTRALLAGATTSETVEGETEARRLLAELVDPDDCWFDHAGGCQAHGFIDEATFDSCPHAQAKRFLAAPVPTEGGEQP